MTFQKKIKVEPPSIPVERPSMVLKTFRALNDLDEVLDAAAKLPKNGIKKLPLEGRDKLVGAHALNAQFINCVGPDALTSCNDEKHEIIYSESWGMTIRRRDGDTCIGVPWSNLAYFQARKD